MATSGRFPLRAANPAISLPTAPPRQWLTWDDNEHLLSVQLPGGDCQCRILFRSSSAPNRDSGPPEPPPSATRGTIGADRIELGLSVTTDRSLIVFRRQHIQSSRPEIYAVELRATMAGPSGDLAGLTQLSHWNEGSSLLGRDRSHSLGPTTTSTFRAGSCCLPTTIPRKNTR